MKPGLARAVPMGFLGFLAGALLVIIIRGLQNMDPLWDAQVGFILAGFMSAGAFLWGMGAFDPRMSTHPHEPEVDEYGLVVAEPQEEHTPPEEDAKPLTVLGYSIWQVSFLTIVLLLLLAGWASLPGGFFLRVSSDPEASTADVGYETIALPFGGPEVEVSQLTVFVGFVIFTLLSLAVIGGVIALVFYSLSYGVTNVRANESAPLGTEPIQRHSAIHRLINLAKLAVLFVVLYLAFYYVLVGLVLPNPEIVRVVVSLANALIFALVITFPLPMLRVVGRVAGWLAKVLRGLPRFLFQR